MTSPILRPEYVDIHSHVNFSAYDADREAVVARALAGKVWMINVGTQKDTSQSALDLARRNPVGVFAAIGLHPVHTAKSYHDAKELGEGGKDFTSRGEEFALEEYLAMAADPKVVAIGECGLDYYHLEPDSVGKQRIAFEQQIDLANRAGKPLMLHIRSNPKGGPSAYSDACEIIRAHAKVGGNVHFFAGSVEEAKKFLDLGFTLSFTGVITFARDYDEVIRFVPLDRIMSETDCPYVTPAPHRGTRNEPSYVREIARKIAEIRGEDLEKTKAALVDNAFRAFGLGRA